MPKSSKGVTMKIESLDKLLGFYRDFEHQRKKKIDEGINDYCLLASVLPTNDEVRLHSRFIYSMINPAGLHYHGNIFLKLFLEQLPSELHDFINLERAVVTREKDRIDLMIHDGEHYLIIENKLRAGDQKYQITRYIKHVREKYLSEYEDVSKNIKVVYLSKSRKQPTDESKSLIGFSLKKQELEWRGLTDEKLDGDVKGRKLVKSINLDIGQKIQFVHMGYFPAIESWASNCLDYDYKDAASNIKNAFKEYLAVLKRINGRAKWRNVMTLDQYALQLEDKDQRDMYAFMIEANKSLVGFVATRLCHEIKCAFNVSATDDLTACEAYPRSITPHSLKNWLNKRPRKRELWRDISCCASDGFTCRVGLILGIEYAYVSALTEEGKITISDETRVSYGGVRKMLTDKNGLYTFVEDIKKMLNKYKA